MRAERYVPRKILDVKNSDRKVSIVGKVLQADENTMVVEDETGQVDVFCDSPAQAGSEVRAFCSVVDGRLKAEAVQSLNGFDINLYKKTQELYRKLGV
jgi:hypothetical protein